MQKNTTIRRALISVSDKTNILSLAADLAKRGVSATRSPDPDSILEHLSGAARGGDVVVIMSNGGFCGLHERLLERLESREAAADLGA